MSHMTQRVNELPVGIFESTDLVFTVNLNGTSELVDLYTPITQATSDATFAIGVANSAMAMVTALEARVLALENA